MNLKSLRNYVYGATLNNFTSLNGLRYVTGLEKIWVDYDQRIYLPNLSDISELSYHKDSLKSLTLNYSNISDIKVLSECSKLEYISLEHNVLAPYVEEEGKPKWFTISEICNRMRLNATSLNKKLTIRLRYNSLIPDWSSYLSDTSKWASDSSYGAS